MGEGGGAYSLGESNHVVMLHYDNIYYSCQGGQNLSWYTNRTNPHASGLPTGANCHSSNLVFSRVAGSRSVPAGPVFTIMGLPAPGEEEAAEEAAEQDGSETADTGDAAENADADAGRDRASPRNRRPALVRTDFGELRDGVGAGVPGVHYLLRSLDFGLTWSWFKLPPHLQTANVLAADPTDAKTLYALGSGCLSHSTDCGETWSPCSTAPGIGCDGPCPPGVRGTPTYPMASLVVKDSRTMLIMRRGGGAPPLRSTDGGGSWVPWDSFPAAARSTGGAPHAGYSWTGKTLVIYGSDPAAPQQGKPATFVMASTDDGATWADWSAGLVTMAPASAAWWRNDFYLSSAGEGIMLRRGAE